MNSKTYFQKVSEKYGNGFWVNNPTLAQSDLAISAGSIGCTTNPTYTSKMLVSPEEGQRTHSLLSEILKTTDDIQEAARLLQRKSIIPLLEKFLPVHTKSNGRHGFVSIQGDPFAEGNPDMIIKEALEDIKLGKNVIAKIPTTEAGIIAISYLAARNIPIIATEVMSLAQVVKVCEAYKQAVSGKSERPALYVTHITGIFDDYINAKVKELGVNISSDVLAEAGLIIARKQYALMTERGYDGIMLGGGARKLEHFTGIVGGNVDITINWKGTADKLIELNPPIEDILHSPINEDYAKILLDTLPDYELAYEPDALNSDKFESYGPVVLFRNAFLKGWQTTLDEIKKVREIR